MINQIILSQIPLARTVNQRLEQVNESLIRHAVPFIKRFIFSWYFLNFFDMLLLTKQIDGLVYIK